MTPPGGAGGRTGSSRPASGAGAMDRWDAAVVFRGIMGAEALYAGCAIERIEDRGDVFW